MSSIYKGLRFPAEIISHCVWGPTTVSSLVPRDRTADGRPRGRYCQFLWMSEFQATSDPVPTGSSAPMLAVMSVGRSSNLPLWKTARPAPAQPNAVR